MSQRDIYNANCDARLEILRVKRIAQLQQIADGDEIIINGQQKAAFLQLRSQRGSRYRGVSKNGHKWQVSTFLKCFLRMCS